MTSAIDHRERGTRGQILNVSKKIVVRAWRKKSVVRALVWRNTDGTRCRHNSGVMRTWSAYRQRDGAWKLWFTFSPRCQYVITTLLLRPRRCLCDLSTLLLRPRKCPCDITTLSLWPWCVPTQLRPSLLRLDYAQYIRSLTLTANIGILPWPANQFSVNHAWRQDNSASCLLCRIIIIRSTVLPSTHHAQKDEEEKIYNCWNT